MHILSRAHIGHAHVHTNTKRTHTIELSLKKNEEFDLRKQSVNFSKHATRVDDVIGSDIHMFS